MATKSILTFNAKNGMVIAKDVVTSSGNLLLPAGTVVDSTIKNTLFAHTILNFEIEINDEDMVLPPIQLKENIEPIRELNVLNRIEAAHYNELYNEAIDFFKTDINSIVFQTSQIDLNILLDVPYQIIQNNKPTMNVLEMLMNADTKADAVYAHSFNVALIAGVIGEWLEMSESEISVLMIAGLLHDIGKLLLPQDVFNKAGKLTDTEYKIIKTHPMLGYNIIKDIDIDPRIKECALYHHERCDGSGYPENKKGDELSDFVKIIAIADVYDAMINKRSYRRARSPFEAVSMFETEGFHKFDTKILLTFLNRILSAYINTYV
ncbi:MAG: HD-GYP domain-containing protein, partial [Lachnospiraceae bacterium]|nr:HD-GYP domain-containing protein [Lachnospiraceae bacterium]